MTDLASASIDPPDRALPERFQLQRGWADAVGESFFGRWVFGERGLPGDDQIRRFGELLLESDPLADRVAALDDEIGAPQNRRLLERALEAGVDSIPEAPAPLVELMRASEREPVWLDHELLALGSRVSMRSGLLAGVILRDLALMGGYKSSALAKPLVFTGALETGVDGRLAETGTFWIDVTRPGGLELRAPGWQTALRVRVMHSRLRRRIRSHADWDDRKWGVPINQGDLLATNQAFSALFLMGLRLFGLRVTPGEGEAVMHLWKYVGTLLGIREDVLPATEREGRRILYLTGLTHPPPDDDSRFLARALLDEPRGAARHANRFFGDLEANLHHGFSRFFLDAATCRDLGIEPTPWVAAPVLLLLGNLPFEIARRFLPGGDALATRIGGWLQGRHHEASRAGRETRFEPVTKLARDAA